MQTAIATCSAARWQCKVAHCDIPPKGMARAVTGIANHTGIRRQFDHILQPFSKLLQRRAFLHWFVGEGMEEIGVTFSYLLAFDLLLLFVLEELTEAEDRIKDLSESYKQYEHISSDHDGDDDSIETAPPIT